MLKQKSLSRFLLPCCILVFVANGAVAQSAGPQGLPMPAPIAAPKDIPYSGVIQLHVDATDISRHIFQVHEIVPVTGGESLVLMYPQWLPANHAAYGRVEHLAGLVIHANGERLEWMRDPVNVFAFHVPVPAGVTAIEVDFQFLSAVDESHGRIMMTPEMLNLQWNTVALYPASHFARQILVKPSVQVPDGWQIASALKIDSSSGGITTFDEVTLENLVDSPIFAGKYFKRMALNPEGSAPVYLNVVADRADLLEVQPEQLQAHHDLVQQAEKVFGSHHYGQYDFLLAVTDRLGGIGLEHHQSSENSVASTYFTDWEKGLGDHDLLPHEYTHSWNGKYRRPADLWTANYDVPMRGSLLWVYEGQTQFWGVILAARAGLLTRQQALDSLAIIAATYEYRVGREWRAMQDTTNDPIIAMRRPLPWRSWERREDYYSEGLLIWLDADTLIRELSGSQKSLDDFARLFFGTNNGSIVPSTYLFEDVVVALNTVQPHDWDTFLRSRLDGHGPGAPLDGIGRGGYKLVYTDTPSKFFEDTEVSKEHSDLTYSLGVVITADNILSEVLWKGPAYDAGLTVGNQIIAVNGIAFDVEDLSQAIAKAENSDDDIEVLVRDGDHYRTVSIGYHGGLRYPHLVRDDDISASLDHILTPVD